MLKVCRKSLQQNKNTKLIARLSERTQSILHISWSAAGLSSISSFKDEMMDDFAQMLEEMPKEPCSVVSLARKHLFLCIRAKRRGAVTHSTHWAFKFADHSKVIVDSHIIMTGSLSTKVLFFWNIEKFHSVVMMPHPYSAMLPPSSAVGRTIVVNLMLVFRSSFYPLLHPFPNSPQYVFFLIVMGAEIVVGEQR